MKKGIYISPTEFVSFADGGSGSSPKSLSKEIAVRSRSSDFFAIGNMYLPNPDPVLKANGKDIETYSDLRTDDRVSGSMTNRFNASLALNWQIDKGKSGAGRQLKAIEAIFSKLALNRIMGEILQSRAFGYAPLEIIWGQRDGLNVPIDLLLKPQRWFVFGQQNELRFRSHDHVIDGEELPLRQFLCPTNDSSYDNPYGLGLLSRCFWPVVFKRGGWRFRIQFAEKFGQIWPIGKLPREASPKQQDEMLDILTRMIQDGVAVIPDDGSVDFKESGTKGATSELYQSIIADANNAISTVWLGHAGAGESVAGDLGGKDVAGNVRDDLRDSDKSLIEETLNQLIDHICEVNWNSAEGAPRFSLWEEEEVDQAQADRDKALTESLGRSGLKLTRQYFQREYNLADGDIEDAPAAEPSAVPASLPAVPAKAMPSFSGQMGDRIEFSPQLTYAEPGDSLDSADVVAGRLDEAASPIIGKWLAAIRNEADGAGNLIDLRAKLLEVKGLDIAPLAGQIRDALLLARLGGRAEVIDEIAASEAGASFAEIERMHSWTASSQFAEPELLSAFNLPFKEAIDFFRNKVNVPTKAWNDLWLDQHSQGFMIAGAVKGELLADLRDAVDQAISAGDTLEDFRKQWDQIALRHGWQYQGGRNWRTRIVYETNTRQAYNAGRWQQVTDPDVLATRPYLLYRHGGSSHPRILHLSWNGTCLPADDPWWSTHYPQNGWGCKCKVFSAGQRDIQRLGDKVKLKAPNDGAYAWTDKQGRTYMIPNGIDPGFQYNPGQAANRTKQIMEDRIGQLPSDIAGQIRAEIAKGGKQ